MDSRPTTGGPTLEPPPERELEPPAEDDCAADEAATVTARDFWSAIVLAGEER